MKLLCMKQQDRSAEERGEGKEEDNGKARKEVRAVPWRLHQGLSPCLCRSEIKSLNAHDG